MIQADWPPVIPIDPIRVGIAGTSTALLKPSKNCAKQSMKNITSLRVKESRFPGSSASVPAGEATTCDDSDIVLKTCKRKYCSQTGIPAWEGGNFTSVEPVSIYQSIITRIVKQHVHHQKQQLTSRKSSDQGSSWTQQTSPAECQQGSASERTSRVSESRGRSI